MGATKRSDLLAYSIENLRNRQLRSWLTVLGIVVGIAAVVTLISISLGLAKSIDDQLSQFGSRTIAVIPGDVSKQMAISGGGMSRPPAVGKLFANDADRIRRVDCVEYVSKAIAVRSDMAFKGKGITAGISGIEPNLFKQVQVLEIAQGRFLTDTDRNTIVVGDKLANEIFDKNKILVGSVVAIGSERQAFRVVGVLKKSGVVGGALDSSVFMPIDDARKLAGGSVAKNEVSAIRLTVKEGCSVSAVADKISMELLSAHKVREENKDFSVITSDFIIKQVGQITALLSVFLGGIASISLLVGGVGIANTMFMAVIERTKEIGILKAVGASNSAILQAFLIESALIGLGGGIIGIVVGALFAFGVSFFGVPFVLPAELVIGTAAFSLLVGLVSGFVPARNAAMLQPVEALRFE